MSVTREAAAKTMLGGRYVIYSDVGEVMRGPAAPS